MNPIFSTVFKDQQQKEAEHTRESTSLEVAPGSPAAILRLQCMAGNRAFGQLLRSRGLHSVQPKLTIGQPDDPYEREADQMAEHVVQRPVLLSSAVQAKSEMAPELQVIQAKSEMAPDLQVVQAKSEMAPDLQRECEDCKISPPSPEDVEEEKEEEAGATTINRKADQTDAASAGGSLVGLQDGLKKSKSGGRPLPQDIRQEMEDGFGEDFSNVRVHTGSQATSMNRSIQAKAFTHENQIYFNTGRYNPNSKDGRLLLAHELAHVVQQTGSHPIKPKIQRSPELKLGNWAHNQIQERLRNRDNKLITEAPIPGGTRDDKKINVVGFADLYKAEKQTVSGISAQEPKESKEAPEQPAFYKYVNMRRDWLGKAKPRPTDKSVGPKIKSHKKDIWDFNPNFPSNFQIGEIKPLFPEEFPESFAYHGTGFLQAGNYREGFREFVERVYQDNPKHQSNLPSTITGRPLNLNKTQIPDAINYAEFEQQYLTQGQEAILRRDNKRVWIYRLKDGVYVYFLLPDPYTSKEFPGQIERQLQRLDPLLKRLRQKRGSMANTLLTKRESPQKVSPTSATLRKPAPGIQAKGEDWNKLAEAWETERRNWVKGTGTGIEKPKTFLKEQAKGVEKKAKIDKKLNVTPSTKLKEQISGVKKIRFWSSLRGRILGGLYFRFRKVFDKVEDLFDRVKAGFKKHHQKADEHIKKGTGILDGWKKTATKAIIRFGAEILKEMLVEAFRGFVNCMNGIIEAVLKKFTSAVDEAKEDLVKEIEPVCCEVMDFKNKLEEEYKKHEKTIASFTEAVQTIQQWQEILDDVETAVRIGVQAVSCASPPGLGCLWGLVAQLTISAGLNLLSRTDYFEEEIAKPAARTLMDAIVGDSLHNFLVEILENTPLKPYVQEAQACRRRTQVIGGSSVVGGSSVIGGNLHKLDPNDPKIAKIREEWEKEFESQILADLQAVFEKGKGKKVTKEDLQKLVEFLQNLKKSPDEIKKMLEAARNPKTGKLNLEKAKENLEKEKVPEAEPKERKIDYEKATRSNAKFEQILGWKPEQFYKKPGIKADTEEFADAIYDMQEALDMKADGILGEETVIAFYEKNKLKKDLVYNEAVRVRDKKKAEKEKKEAERTKPGEAPKATFTLLNGPDYVIKDKDKSQNVPRSVAIYLHHPDYRELVKEPSPGDRELAYEPKLVTLDIYVSGSHVHRIQNVSVKSLELWKTVAATGVAGIWSLVLTLEDGIQLSPLIYPDEELILRQQVWSAD